jgi:hypothetical protein
VGGLNFAATDSADRVSDGPQNPPRRRPRALRAAPARATAEKKEGQEGDVGQYVDLQPVGLPIVSNRVVVNYVFVYIRINLTSAANASQLRQKEPDFRDALVLLATGRPSPCRPTLSKIDTVRLTAALKQEAGASPDPARSCRWWSPPRPRGGGYRLPGLRPIVPIRRLGPPRLRQPVSVSSFRPVFRGRSLARPSWGNFRDGTFRRGRQCRRPPGPPPRNRKGVRYS